MSRLSCCQKIFGYSLGEIFGVFARLPENVRIFVRGNIFGVSFWGVFVAPKNTPPAQTIFPGQYFLISGYWLLVGRILSRTICHLWVARGVRCPCAARIWAERIAVSLLRMALGEKLRRSFRVSTGFGHRSSQFKSILACSWGCCSVFFFLIGAGRLRSSRSKIVTAAIRRCSVVRCDHLRFVLEFWAGALLRL